VTDTRHDPTTPRPDPTADPRAWPQQGAPTGSVPGVADAGGAPAGAGSGLRLVALVVGVVALGLIFGWSVLAIVFAIAVSIFLHEMGHFLVAKWAGMKVTEYFIGFGPRIWSFRRGETEYGLKVIPAGAYVRIIGMHNLEQVDPADEARTYRAQPYRKRLPVVLAGPFANFLIAIVLLFAIFLGWGKPNPDSWTVDRVVAGSAAAQAGLEPGDRIVSFDGRPVGDFDDLSARIQPAAGREVDITYVRDGVEQTASVVLGWRLSAQAAAMLPPLHVGDRILSVNGQPVASYDALAATLASSDPGQVTVEFDRGGYRYATELDTPVSLPAEAPAGFLGLAPDVANQRLNPLAAVGEAGATFGSLVKDSVVAIGDRFSPSGIGEYVDTVSNASSDESQAAAQGIRPVSPDSPNATPAQDQEADANRFISLLGIVRLGSQAADSGPQTFLSLLVMVNVFLGLLNLLPLPPLDGGHAAIATYEAVREKLSGRRYRVDITKVMPLTYAMVLVLVGIFVTSLYLDIVDPVANPFGP
jgi:RIP metalloprotease RseP